MQQQKKVQQVALLRGGSCSTKRHLKLRLRAAPRHLVGWQHRSEAGAAGKVFKVEATVGQAVKRGDAVVILEAMKMEIPVVAPEDGTVASINVAVGDPVEAGALLATLK